MSIHPSLSLFSRPLPQPQPAVLPLILPGVVLQVYAAVPQASGKKSATARPTVTCLKSCVKFTFLCDSRNLSSKLWNRNTNKTTVSTFDFSQGPERPAQPRALPRDRRPLQLEGVRRGLPLRRGIQDEPGAQVRGLVATTPPSSSPQFCHQTQNKSITVSLNNL